MALLHGGCWLYRYLYEWRLGVSGSPLGVGDIFGFLSVSE